MNNLISTLDPFLIKDICNLICGYIEQLDLIAKIELNVSIDTTYVFKLAFYNNLIIVPWNTKNKIYVIHEENYKLKSISVKKTDCISSIVVNNEQIYMLDNYGRCDIYDKNLAYKQRLFIETDEVIDDIAVNNNIIYYMPPYMHHTGIMRSKIDGTEYKEVPVEHLSHENRLLDGMYIYDNKIFILELSLKYVYIFDISTEKIIKIIKIPNISENFRYIKDSHRIVVEMNRIFISHSKGIALFDINGKFIDNIQIIEPSPGFCIHEDKLYVLSRDQMNSNNTNINIYQIY